MLDFLSQRPSQVMVSHREPLLRAGIASTLRAHAGFKVATGQGEDACERPPLFDVVVTDYDSALRFADKATRESTPGSTGTRILVLTAIDREADIRRAIAAGVQGYLLLDTEPAELVEGVATVARGSRYWSRSVAMRMVDSLTHENLTEREAQVLQLVADGEPNKGIAKHLHIEIGTVKSHISAIMGKLGATSRTHAARIGAVRGLVKDRALAPA